MQHTTVNKRIFIASVAVLAAIFLWLGMRPGNPTEGEAGAHTSKSRTSQHEAADRADGVAPVRTKVADRAVNALRPTHSPERLREFMLPAMAIQGLSLDEALRKLMAAYQDACLKSGETPLPLMFTVPAAANRKLMVHLPAGNFNNSVQLLATLSGMKASRKDREYRFEPLAGERKQVSRELQVPPDFNTTLNVMAGVETAIEPGDPFARQEPIARKTASECLTALGLDLDPSTQVSLGASGKLTLETSSAVDAAAISDLAKSLSDQAPTQTKFTTKVLELPAGSEWTAPDTSHLTDAKVQLLMREMAQKKGAELMTMPSIAARNGQDGTIEINHELISPIDDTGEAFETHDLGHVLKLKGSRLGFGQEVGFEYTDTIGELDPSTGRAVINKRTEIKSTGFTPDGGTRFEVKTRPDGTQTLLLVTSEIIDATGRPVRDPG